MPLEALDGTRDSEGQRREGPTSRVSSAVQAEMLYGEIIRPGRRYPIIGLTCRPAVRDPALRAEQVQAVVWPDVPIYVIEPREARTLNNLLPSRLGAYNGAIRVWWPGVDEKCLESWHPLIGFNGRALDRLAAEFATRLPDEIYDLSPDEQATLRGRLRIAESVSQVISVTTPRDVRRLTSVLRAADREWPVVVLSTVEGASGPSFPVEEVRSAVDPFIPVYVLANSGVARRLEHALGGQLGVHEGDARIYWPSLIGEEAEHPRIACTGPGPTRRLVEALNLSRPEVRGRIEGTQDRLADMQQRATENARAAREARSERDAAISRAEAAETALAEVQAQLAALTTAGLDAGELRMVAAMDREAAMQRLICREWLTSLEGTDRRELPLGAYRLGAHFLDSIESRRIATPQDRIAFVCAMVACGRAAELPGLEPHPWRAGKASGSGDDPQALRADGGKGLMCNLGHGRGAARLLYWTLPGGPIEFDSVRNHDAIGQGM